MKHDEVIEKMASMAVAEGYAYEMGEIEKEANKVGDMFRGMKTRASNAYAGAKGGVSKGYNAAKGGVVAAGKHIAKHPYRYGGGAAAAAAVGGGGYMFLRNRAQGKQ